MRLTLRRNYSQKLKETLVSDLSNFFSGESSGFSPKFLKGRNNIRCSRIPQKLKEAAVKLLNMYPRSMLHRALYSIKSRLDTPMLPANPTPNISKPLSFSKWEWSESEVFGYVATEMPKSIAVVERILTQELKQRDINITSVWDFGSGTGAVKWAVQEVFPGAQVVEEDLSPLMCKVNQELFGHNQSLSDVFGMSVAAFTLGELIDREAIELALEQLVARTQKYALVIDHGTSQGFERVLLARNYFIEKDFDIMAPCLHNGPCPLAKLSQVCSFEQRLENPPYMNELRSAENKQGYTDVSFSYVLARQKTSQSLSVDNFESSWEGRIVRKGLKKSGHVINDLCTEEGKLMRYVNTRGQGKSIYYDARKSYLGDLWPHPSKAKMREIVTY